MLHGYSCLSVSIGGSSFTRFASNKTTKHHGRLPEVQRTPASKPTSATADKFVTTGALIRKRLHLSLTMMSFGNMLAESPALVTKSSLASALQKQWIINKRRKTMKSEITHTQRLSKSILMAAIMLAIGAACGFC